jgi:hypothetical protein
VGCAQCGGELPTGARFCPTCGLPVVGAEPGDPGPEHTTASIDVGAFDPSHDPGSMPALVAGTGMLVVVRGPGAGSRYLLDRDETTIGRHPDAHVLLDDVTVSREHARVLRIPSGFSVGDLASLNGTYVNGERIEDRALVTGDELQVGRFKLLFVGESVGRDGEDAR